MSKDKLLEKISKMERIELHKPDFEKTDSPDFIKELRKKLEMTQQLFADSIGVSVKTVEKWESGDNPVQGPTARLLYLIDKNPALIKEIFDTREVPNKDESIYSVVVKDREKNSGFLNTKKEKIENSTFKSPGPELSNEFEYKEDGLFYRELDFGSEELFPEMISDYYS